MVRDTNAFSGSILLTRLMSALLKLNLFVITNFRFQLIFLEPWYLSNDNIY